MMLQWKYNHDRKKTLDLIPRSVAILVLYVLSLLLLLFLALPAVQAQQHQRHHQEQNDLDPPPPLPTSRTGELDSKSTSTFEKDDVLQTNPKAPVDQNLLAPFDTDIRQDCRSLISHCQSEIFAHIYLQCPAMCTKYLEQEGMKGTAGHNSEEFYSGTLRTFQGKRIDADRFEGFVTVVAIVPLLPGMAFYYYEMMETLHTQFDPKVEFVIIPIDLGEGIHIRLHPKPNVVILEEETAVETHSWVQHLTSIKPRSGAATKNHRDEVVQVDLPTDRLTVYVVSSDGYFVERMTVPTMAMLQRTIAIFLKTIGYDDL